MDRLSNWTGTRSSGSLRTLRSKTYSHAAGTGRKSSGRHTPFPRRKYFHLRFSRSPQCRNLLGHCASEQVFGITILGVTASSSSLLKTLTGARAASGCSLQCLNSDSRGWGSAPTVYWFRLSNPGIFSVKIARALWGWIRGPLLRNMSRLIAPRSVLEPLGT